MWGDQTMDWSLAQVDRFKYFYLVLNWTVGNERDSEYRDLVPRVALMDLSVKYLTVLSCWLKKYLLLVALKPHFTLVCGHFIDNAIDRLLRCTHLLLAGLARSKAKPSQAKQLKRHTLTWDLTIPLIPLFMFVIVVKIPFISACCCVQTNGLDGMEMMRLDNNVNYHPKRSIDWKIDRHSVEFPLTPLGCAWS